MAAFDDAFLLTVGQEGGYTADPNDPGNWTGGSPGKGVCHGTHWGISAASYPATDIKALSQAEAKTIYRKDFWNRIQGDALPPSLALLVFDAAVNNGVQRAAVWLQGALAVATDGQLGPQTLAALQSQCSDPAQIAQLCCEFQARRMDFMACLSTWHHYGLGWSRRLCRTLNQAVSRAA